MNSGASDHLLDDELIARLRDRMRDYKKLMEARIIVTAGNKVLATATDTLWAFITDQAGQRGPVRISAMVVPGLGRNVFSSDKSMNSGENTAIKMGRPHVQFNGSASIPLNQHPEGKGLCSY